ncbi:MAG: hypothetical protein HYU99_06870 [Deltaproteobacteria bacterium]|nr:hypothetical protein [Deltaproteobacteria bacterium]
MKKNFFPLLLSVLVLSAALFPLGAWAKKKTTTQQAQVLQTKDFHSGFKDVFKTTMNVLQDNNFIIMSANYDAGLIYAQTGSKPGFGITKKVSLSANFDKISERTTTLRVNMMLTKSSSSIFLLGGSAQSESGKPLDDTEVYQRFFAAIEKALFVRKELAK